MRTDWFQWTFMAVLVASAFLLAYQGLFVWAVPFAAAGALVGRQALRADAPLHDRLDRFEPHVPPRIAVLAAMVFALVGFALATFPMAMSTVLLASGAALLARSWSPA